MKKGNAQQCCCPGHPYPSQQLKLKGKRRHHHRVKPQAWVARVRFDCTTVHVHYPSLSYVNYWVGAACSCSGQPYPSRNSNKAREEGELTLFGCALDSLLSQRQTVADVEKNLWCCCIFVALVAFLLVWWCNKGVKNCCAINMQHILKL